MAPGLLPSLPRPLVLLVFVLFVVEQGLAGGSEIDPAVGVKHGAVHGVVQFAELEDLG